MRLDDIPLFAGLKSRMGWLDARQKVVAQNVANADTPGYVPRDLKAQSFASLLPGSGAAAGVPSPGPVRMVSTARGHLSPAGEPVDRFGRPLKTPDSETTLDGNAVVLEEQMLRMAESRMAFDAAIGLYQKSLAMIRMAARPPGR